MFPGSIRVGIGLAATPAVAFTAVTTVFGVGQLIGVGAVPVFAAIVFACGTVAAAIDARLARASATRAGTC